MSYCGNCGTFYSPTCPNRESGSCSPSVNPYEEEIVKANAMLVSARARISAIELAAHGCNTGANMLTAIADDLDKRFNP